MKTKDLTDKQIQEQINALEEENANTQRLSFRRGHGWGDGVLEKRRDKINHLLSILAMRKFDKRKATPKKEGLSRTWNSKAKRWVYHYTKRTKKAKKQPDTKPSQREKWLLAGEYKVRSKPKDVRGLGKVVTKGLKKTKKVTKKPKVPPKKEKSKILSTKKPLTVQWENKEGRVSVDWFKTGKDFEKFVKLNPESKLLRIHQTEKFGMGAKIEKTLLDKHQKPISFQKFYTPTTKKPKPKKKKRTKAKPHQRTLFGGL